VRCFIYDAANNLIARPIWDKLYSSNYAQSLDVSFLGPQSYTAKFYAWRPDGGKSQIVSYTFTGPCTHCGDANNDAAVDIGDAVYLIQFVFAGGPAPDDCNIQYGFGDSNGDDAVDISDADYLIEYIFAGGPCPHCCNLPCW
jgi:hypothetical protein